MLYYPLYQWRRAQNKFLQLFNRQTIIVRFDKQSPRPGTTMDEGFALIAWESETEVPPQVLSDITVSDSFRAIISERFRAGARLYALTIDDEVATFLWAKSGAHTARWYVPLNDEDFVIYGVYTFAKYRGRGLAGKLISSAVGQLISGGGDFYADIRATNIASLHAFRKIGFLEYEKTTVNRLVPSAPKADPIH